MIQLGERIQLSNFEELQPGELTILKKMIGNHANKFHDFTKLHITLKEVHKKEKSQKYQVNALLELNSKVYESESTHFNLFFTINEVLDRLKRQVEEVKD
ncbi:HPF/RaiA family ribosome-associated protein [Candidatus Woesearchaeota archaeon]|nr:HPF/RaiA family ribosome-associated protein [Candidatus Woesearchaeota archaeon]